VAFLRLFPSQDADLTPTARGLLETVILVMFSYQHHRVMVSVCCELLLLLYYTEPAQRVALRSLGALDEKGNVVRNMSFLRSVDCWRPHEVLKMLYWARRRGFWMTLYGCRLMEGLRDGPSSGDIIDAEMGQDNVSLVEFSASNSSCEGARELTPGGSTSVPSNPSVYVVFRLRRLCLIISSFL